MVEDLYNRGHREGELNLTTHPIFEKKKNEKQIAKL